MKPLARWAVVTRDPLGRATVVGSYWTESGALAALRVRRSTWNEHPAPKWPVEPTDWGPRAPQRMRVLKLLAEHEPITAAALADRTAMSPRTVERVLKLLADNRHVLRSLEETPSGPVEWWRLRRWSASGRYR